MSLVERLGFKTLSALYSEMSNNDVMEWMAFDILKDPETKERLKKDKLRDAKNELTPELETALIHNVLRGMGF